MQEWKEGIRYGHGNKQTVPMEQLEKDFQEGVQQAASKKLPWRGISDRNLIRDRKILIYGMLQAELDGKDLKTFMAAQVQQAHASMKRSGSRGAPPALLPQLKRQFENAANHLRPGLFEEKVLGWKLTDKVKKQAASKQAASKNARPIPSYRRWQCL